MSGVSDLSRNERQQYVVLQLLKRVDDFDSLSMEIDNRIQNNEFFVVYCSDDDCGSSEELSYQLLDEGFTSIYLFRGGWKLWIDNKMPIEKP